MNICVSFILSFYLITTIRIILESLVDCAWVGNKYTRYDGKHYVDEFLNENLFNII